jgi:phage terminase large subunit
MDEKALADAIKNKLTIVLPHKYKARDYQIPFWLAMASGKKRAVLIWHRRAGKEKTCWNYLIMQAVQKKGIYYYIFPHFSQGRKILWDGIDKEGLKFLDHIPKELIQGNCNSTEMKIRLHNGSIIQIIGSNNVDSLVGTNPVGCVFSEFSLQDPIAWSLIRPILAENKGWAVFNFTPRGQNHAKELYDMAQGNDEWFCQLLTVKDTNVLTEADIQKERDSGMSEDLIQQEYYCSFTLGVEGSYYSHYLQTAKDDGRIISVPHDTQTRVHTAWDIGYGDSTAIIFYQLCGQEIHIIDFYEAHGEGLAHYAKVLRDKPYLYGDHYAPHDIDSHAFSSGLSAREVGASLGITFITLPTLKLSFESGIEAVRGIFPRLWIDQTKCKHLIKAIENYRKEFDTKLGAYKNRPVHDTWSHAADALRYMSIAIRLHVDAAKSGVSDKQSEAWFRQYNPKFD